MTYELARITKAVSQKWPNRRFVGAPRAERSHARLTRTR